MFWIRLESQLWILRITLPTCLFWEFGMLSRIVAISCHACLCFMSWVLREARYLDDLLLLIKLWLEFCCSCIDLLNQDSILYIRFLRLGNMRYSWLRVSFSLITTFKYLRRCSGFTHLTLWISYIPWSTRCFKHCCWHSFSWKKVFLWWLRRV